jgi:hypothetical protein
VSPRLDAVPLSTCGSHRLEFTVMFEVFVHHVSHFANYFHGFHSNVIRNWYASNPKHFLLFLSNQSQFLAILNLSIFSIYNYFKDFDLNYLGQFIFCC